MCRRSTVVLFFSFIFLAVGLSACGDSGLTPPTGGADASVDSGSADDAAPIDAAPARDVADIDGNTGCNTALGKLTVSAGYCVLAKVETTASAFTFSGGTLWTYEQSGAAHKVLEWKFPATNAPLDPAEDFFSFTPTGADVIYANSYLARSPSGLLAVGYNNDDFTSPSGKIIVGAKGKPPGAIEKANGNFSAVFWNDSTMLVNASGGVGKAQDGQGLYVHDKNNPEDSWKLIKGLGDASGFTLINNDVLFVGGYFYSDNSSKLFAFSRKAVKAAIDGQKVLDATTDGVLVYEGATLAATILGNNLVLARANESFAFSDIVFFPFTVGAGDKVALSETMQTVVTANDSGANVTALGSDSGKLGVIFDLAGGKKYLTFFEKLL